MSLSTKQKGDIAMSEAIRYFTHKNYEVLLPLGDKQSYDIVVDYSGTLKKIQVKYAGRYASKGNRCYAALRVTGGNQKRLSAKKYLDDEFDLLFIYTQNNECYLIPWEEVTARNEIYIEHFKYQRYNVSLLDK